MPMSPMEPFLRFWLIFCHIYSLLIDMRAVLPYNIFGYLYGCVVIAVIAGQNLDFVSICLECDAGLDDKTKSD